MFGVWNIYFGLIGINLGIILLGTVCLVLAIIQKQRVKRTCLFDVCFLLFLVGFLYPTLHGRLLQFIFPILLPEKPLVDNNLTFNYASTNLLTFLLFPVVLLILLRRDVSLSEIGLKVQNLKQTALYAIFGVIFIAALFLFSNSFFGFRWINGYTVEGVILWILFVTVISIFTQTLFFTGILFNAHLNYENGFLLAVISILANQLFISAPLPWIAINIAAQLQKLLVTWKTRNIYSAVLMSIASNLIDITLQIL
ncbi:MAG: hypothetical protein QXU11_00935 [Thermoproteota archaeon]